jgi:outer membrane protein OmpA-like peptidoglycan-associated protein
MNALLGGIDAATDELNMDREPSAAPASKRAVDDEPPLGPASGSPIRIPLVAGLKLIAAENEPGRGDYEPIISIAGVTKDLVSTLFSANLPEGNRLEVQRDVRAEDFRSAREFLSWYEPDDPRIFAGTTSFSLSTAIYNDLKSKGHADIVRRSSSGNPLLALVQAVASGNDANASRHSGKLERVEPHPVAFPVLLNDEPVELHAIHARGTFDDATLDFVVLDDPENPLILRLTGSSTGRIVRIVLPSSASTPIEKKLQDDSRIALHGIYFDFGKDTIRPESEPVLRDIATALAHHPDWKIAIEGHTDNIGGDTLNMDLSQRRAAAVKQALIERYRVPAAHLSTTGRGATRPTDSNETASGRARNRRVELVRL